MEGRPVEVNPLAPFLTPAWLQMALHSTLSTCIAMGFAAATPVMLRFVLWSSSLGLAILLPSLPFLLRVFKGEHLRLHGR